MKIATVCRNPFPEQDLDEYVERAVGFALGRFSNRISKITVTLADQNGPRGGADQVCRLQVSLSRVGRDQKNTVVVIEEISPSIREAISIAADRASRTVARTLERRRSEFKGAVSASGE